MAHNRINDSRYGRDYIEDNNENTNSRSRRYEDRWQRYGSNGNQRQVNDQRNQYDHMDPERNQFDNDNNYQRGVYGNSTGVNRGSGQYLHSRDDSDRGYGRSGNMRPNPGYAGSNYGRYDRSFDENNNRNWWDKTVDEMYAFFGDEEAEKRRKMDEVRDNFRGKGPKGYTRSDSKIKDDVSDRLMDDPYVDASDIEVTVENAEVVLTGTVNSRYIKRRAEDLADMVMGVKNVENRLKVIERNRGNDRDYSSGNPNVNM
ncbi:BON domain-containing protein [Aridibaculum aurantiacum]|uniref:BON domain-containing protein n=1 Tax=Aridibaculum aurantiacum TaxID=2810307 RepID=UPI001A978139|nr:BON domain-containing protein [Aridibaculum aurantiacum]